MRDGVAPGVGTGSGIAWERVALTWRGPLPEGAKLGAAGEPLATGLPDPGAKLGAAGVWVVAASPEPGAKDGGVGATVVSLGAKLGAAGVWVVAASPEPGAKDGGVGATVVSSGVAGGFGIGALRRVEDTGAGTGYAPWGEDAGVGTGYVAWGEGDGICDESAWRVRNDLRAADPGVNDGGGVGAERLGNSEDGSRWG